MDIDGADLPTDDAVARGVWPPTIEASRVDVPIGPSLPHLMPAGLPMAPRGVACGSFHAASLGPARHSPLSGPPPFPHGQQVQPQRQLVFPPVPRWATRELPLPQPQSSAVKPSAPTTPTTTPTETTTSTETTTPIETTTVKAIAPKTTAMKTAAVQTPPSTPTKSTDVDQRRPQPPVVVDLSMDDSPAKPGKPAPNADVETAPTRADKASASAIPTDVHEIIVRAKEMRLKTARQPAKKLHESRTTGLRPLDVALAEARIISENVYVQRKPRKWEEDEVPVCSCKRPEVDDLMGCQEDCVNRAALIECLPDYCPCGDRCDNQRIQRGVMPASEVIDAGNKGLGIRTRQFIKQGDFVAEYMGEIVTEQEYHLRRLRYHNEKHRYMMVLSGGEVIDATRMGGLARFINHSCDPNCGVEKWEVNGEERCAIFALRDITAGEELSFDYKFQSFSALEITTCLCGSANCRGYIGANNRAAKQPRKSSASHTALPSERNKALDPITKKARSNRKTMELALERMYRSLAGSRFFTRKEIAMLLESRLLLKRNLQRHLDDTLQFLCLEPYFVSDDSGEFRDMPPVFNVRELPKFPARVEIKSRAERQARLEVVVERLRTRR